MLLEVSLSFGVLIGKWYIIKFIYNAIDFINPYTGLNNTFYIIGLTLKTWLPKEGLQQILSMEEEWKVEEVCWN